MIFAGIQIKRRRRDPNTWARHLQPCNPDRGRPSVTDRDDSHSPARWWQFTKIESLRRHFERRRRFGKVCRGGGYMRAKAMRGRTPRSRKARARREGMTKTSWLGARPTSGSTFLVKVSEYFTFSSRQRHFERAGEIVSTRFRGNWQIFFRHAHAYVPQG